MASRKSLFSLPTCAFVAVGVVLLDQLTKWQVVVHLGDEPPLVIVDRILQLTYRTNTGAAWSMFSGHPLKLAVFSSFVALGLIIWAVRLKPGEIAMRLPLALVVGGAIGNLVDRYRLGYVIDFIDAHWEDSYHFPTFNVADSAVCVGTGILFVLIVWFQPEPEAEAGDSPREKVRPSGAPG